MGRGGSCRSSYASSGARLFAGVSAAAAAAATAIITAIAGARTVPSSSPGPTIAPQHLPAATRGKRPQSGPQQSHHTGLLDETERSSQSLAQAMVCAHVVTFAVLAQPHGFQSASSDPNLCHAGRHRVRVQEGVVWDTHLTGDRLTKFESVRIREQQPRRFRRT